VALNSEAYWAAKRGAFGDYLRELRGERSRRVIVAGLEGRNQDWYRHIEDGNRSFLRTSEIGELAQALGVPANDIFRRAQKAGY